MLSTFYNDEIRKKAGKKKSRKVESRKRNWQNHTQTQPINEKTLSMKRLDVPIAGIIIIRCLISCYFLHPQSSIPPPYV